MDYMNAKFINFQNECISHNHDDKWMTGDGYDPSRRKLIDFLFS